MYLTAAQYCQRPVCSFSAVLIPLQNLTLLMQPATLSPLASLTLQEPGCIPTPLQWLLHFLCWRLLLFLLPNSAYSKRLRPWPYYPSLSDPLLNKNNSNNIIIIAANTEHLLWLGIMITQYNFHNSLVCWYYYYLVLQMVKFRFREVKQFA